MSGRQPKPAQPAPPLNRYCGQIITSEEREIGSGAPRVTKSVSRSSSCDHSHSGIWRGQICLPTVRFLVSRHHGRNEAEMTSHRTWKSGETSRASRFCHAHGKNGVCHAADTAEINDKNRW